MELREFLLSYFTGAQYEPMRTKELADQFGLAGEARIAFYDTIDAMLEGEVIKMSKRGKIKAYALPERERDESQKKNKRQRNAVLAGNNTDEERKESGVSAEKEQRISQTKQSISPKENSQKPQEKPVSPKEKDPLIGELVGNAKGFAFFVSSVEDCEDVFISPDDLNGAMHGDTVRIAIIEKADSVAGKNAKGRVIAVLSRNADPIAGVYEKQNGCGYVLPDRKNFSRPIFISDNDSLDAQEGDKVILHLLPPEANEGHPAGHITEVLGPEGKKGVDITAVARQFRLPYAFSEEAKKEAEALSDEVDKREFRGRRDLRNLFTVTIDGADAKDFDDAISLEKRGKYYVLYVHIADVSHYVKPGSALDHDAYERGNSVYLLDRVIPMLPEKLSNGLCSLNPGVERLAMTTQMTLDAEGNIVDHQFYTSVIRSDYRLVYEDVSDYLEEGTRFSEEGTLLSHIEEMATLYHLLAKKRKERGTLDFAFPETAVILNDEGIATDVRLADRRIANRLIEEFMILNNVVIGTTFFRKKLPFIYRIHAEPKAEDIERLNNALIAFHYEPIEADPEPSRIRTILEQVKGKKEEGILNMLVLQSMSKAVYSPKPTMHYGLAEEHYSHFTSPIRRYSDLIAHRLLKALLSGNPLTEDAIKKDLFVRCEHLSLMEQKAEEAERDVVEMKCAEYMQRFIGEEFIGQVVSLTNFGVFIRLPNTVEGLAHFRDMTDDYYSYDEDRMMVSGEKNHHELRYGDEVRVLVAAANPLLREIDFHLPDFVQVHEQKEKQSGTKHKPSREGSHSEHVFGRRRDIRPKNFKGAKVSKAGQPRKKGTRHHRNAPNRQGRRKGGWFR